MVVERSVSVRDVKTVVDGMEMPVKELVDMEQAVHKVLPGVDHKTFARRPLARNEARHDQTEKKTLTTRETPGR